ncbi:ATP-binding cassette domain-containing protein [Limosilactobacillus sp.]|uniref:ATP-binding cassette domain-containing protein n=1 Tax=Limosilactobacillus sp. TaxID=2773925 RepID=UPI00345E82CD
MTSLSAHQLSFAYDDREIFHRLDFTVPMGEFSLLTGPSGSGKSSLLKLLAGLFPQYGGRVTSGQVSLNGQNAAEIVPFQRATKVAMLFQHPARQFAMRTVNQQIDFALANLQLSAAEIYRRRQWVLGKLALQQFAHRLVTTLSGGEQQRVALACVLAMDSEIILLDEPFANVDINGRKNLLQILKRLQETGKTIFLADHDPTGYRGIASRLFRVDADAKTVRTVPLENLPTEEENLTPVRLSDELLGERLRWHDLTYGVGERQLVHNSSFTLPAGKIGLLSGKNGAGKSTLFNVLSRQHHFTGQLSFDSVLAQKVPLRKWALKVGQVFQNSTDQFISMTVKQELAISRKHSRQPDYWTPRRIDQCLADLNLSRVVDHVCYRLSGGQQKKLQLLSMLIMAQPVLLLDEPFAGLDLQSIQRVLQLLMMVKKDLQTSILIISHQRYGIVAALDYELRLTGQRLILQGRDSDEQN